ncbi:cytochrome P450 [Aspergillus campestris IBT 28561]|uniref:Cytochrome P450 n=1 Tax=Aspergillus campestris (strain IBT 28561) TaxID=1392248 RepID=A0A2I1CXX0_ASPC2|nr:cytochrome P450 [Aspergillus campestris IBT 28561]PKY02461.1 cytochrome P450 [Aspergillus campestris IBT 28561]
MELHVSFIPLLAILGALIYRFLVYPLFVSPLSKIPAAHWSCRFCSIWIYWMRWTNQENRAVYDKHMKLGAAVLLGPNLLGINSFDDGVKKIYQGGFPKPPFYFNGFAIYNTENIFTFEENAAHSARKRMISNTFSKSFVISSPTARAATRDVLFGRYLPMLRKASSEDKPLEVLGMNYSYSMDTFVQWQFGRSLGSNLLEDLQERKLYLDGFFAPYPFLFWMYYFPKLANFLRRVGVYLIPKSVDAKFGAAEDWNLEKCDSAQQLLASSEPLHSEDQPVVFQQALQSMSEPTATKGAYPRRMQIASDMFAHSSAAFETSGNTETYVFYEMCRNPEWQKKLYEELRGVKLPQREDLNRKIEIDDITEPKDIDTLPILHAIIMETLRLWPAVPGGQPRVVPKTTSLGGYANIPAGTIVQSYACVLHRTPEVFPDPFQWKPQRWLDASPAELANMKRWFWAFSSGPRMCIGSNFAYYSMKYLVAAVYANYTTSIHDQGDMDLLDSYLAGPKGHHLELKFHRVPKHVV